MSNFGLMNILGIIVGLGIIVNSALTFIHREELIDSGLETTAIITEINSTGRYSSYRVYAKYTIEGVTYNHILNIAYSGRNSGQEVTILYNPNNPNTITPRDRENAIDNNGYLVARSMIGVLLILVSVFLGRINVQKTQRMFY